MTVKRRQPCSDEPYLRLVASDGQGVQRPRKALTATRSATLDGIAVAIAETASMPLADALIVLERARRALPREVAAVESIFASLAAFEASALN